MEINENLPPLDSPTHPNYMKALSEAKAKEMADYWNERYNEYFLNFTLPNWVTGVMDNGDVLPLPTSPPMLEPRNTKLTFGWQPSVESVGPRYSREDILIALDIEYQKSAGTTKSLWDVVSSAVLEACGIESPSTPDDFGKELGPHLPGYYYVNPKAGFIPQGTRRTVNGITYELAGTLLKYWRPVSE